MKVVNVKADEVFKMLAHENEVYAVDVNNDILCNLRYEPVIDVLAYVNNNKYAFFIMESED